MSRPLVDIRLEALSTRGGKPPGLDSISVHVRYGEFFTFLGPPHSGKTSRVLMRDSRSIASTLRR